MHHLIMSHPWTTQNIEGLSYPNHSDSVSLSDPDPFDESSRNSALCVATEEAIGAELGYTQAKADLANGREVAVKQATTLGSIAGFWTTVKVSVSLTQYDRALYRPLNSL